jgi:predicted dinucleotide-binding enzyme
MKIAIIGSGKVGSALGRRWAGLGHEIIYGTREPGSEKIATLLEATGPQSRAASPQEAAASAEVVVLAVPGMAGEATVRRLGWNWRLGARFQPQSSMRRLRLVREL